MFVLPKLQLDPPQFIGSDLPDIVWDHMAMENWQLSLPNEGWMEEGSIVPGIQLIAKNETLPCMVLLIKEPQDEGTDRTTYVIETLRIISVNGTQVLGINQVMINGEKMAMVRSHKSEVPLLIWIGLKNHIGYSLSCIGEIDLCKAIAETWRIN
jgi:hypothetical protein